MTHTISPTMISTRWPFSTMNLSTTVRVGPLTAEMAARGRNAAYVAATRRKCKMIVRSVPGLMPDEWFLEVACVAAEHALASTALDRRKGAEVVSTRIPDVLRPGNKMPLRYKGGYPFQALGIGEVLDVTPAEMSLEALHRMAQYARCWRQDSKRYSVKLLRHHGLPSRVKITRVR